MSDRDTRLVLDDFSGGRNNADAPLGPKFQASQVIDAVNGDWYRTTGFRKRWGSSGLSMTGSGLTGHISWLGRHVPGSSDADAELWTTDNTTGVFYRLDNSTTWTAPANPQIDHPQFAQNSIEITSASLNGYYFLSYPNASGLDRLHVYDPTWDYVRRTGIDPGTVAPTVANVGSGAYPATLRYYRVRFIGIKPTGQLIQRSEPTPSVAFTPSGTGAVARVSRPPLPADEAANRWELEVSTDNVTFYQYCGYERGNYLELYTTYYDYGTYPGSDIATWLAPQGLVSALTGTHALQKSYRLIAADQNRLLGWGSWIPTDKQNRLEISAIVGSLDKGDAERVDKTVNYFIDFDELDSGPPRALVGPVWDRFYAFKSRQMYELIPTGSIEQPYRRVKISGELGCVGSHAACRGEDASGSPCLYMLTHRGVYRYGLSGFEYIGRGIEDLILGPTSRIHMAAPYSIGHMVFYPELNQLWVWFATGTSDGPDTLCVFDVAANGGRGAWTQYTGVSVTAARCSVMFANEIGATMGFSMVPYIGTLAIPGAVIKVADSLVTNDIGNPYRAYIVTRPLSVPGFRVATGDVQLLAPGAPDVSLTCTVTPDFGASPTVTGTATLTPIGSETRVTRPFSGSALGGAEFVQLVIGDAAPNTNRWSFDRVIVPIQNQEPVTG